MAPRRTGYGSRLPQAVRDKVMDMAREQLTAADIERALVTQKVATAEEARSYRKTITRAVMAERRDNSGDWSIRDVRPEDALFLLVYCRFLRRYTGDASRG